MMPETGELTYRRVHRASPELLFECMTTPEHLTHFWGPAGTTTPVGNITVDLRPGGVFETTMVSDADGSTYTMRAVYVEVRRPERLVWIDPEVEGGMRTTITFPPAGLGAAGGDRPDARLRRRGPRRRHRAARPDLDDRRPGAGPRRWGQPGGAAVGGEGDHGRAAGGGYRTLDGQTHAVAPEALAPVLVEFFRG